MFPRSIGLATTYANPEFKVPKAPRAQDLAALPKGSAVREAAPMSSTAVALKGAAAPAFDGVDYADKLRHSLRSEGAGAGAVYAPWLVGDVAGQDAPEVLGSKPLTSGYIVATTGLQRADIARFGQLGSITAEPMPPGAEGPLLHLGPAPPGAPDDRAGSRPWEAAMMSGSGRRGPDVDGPAHRGRTPQGVPVRRDLTEPPLPPLLPPSEQGEGFTAASASGQTAVQRPDPGAEQRFWTGSEFVPVKGQSVDQLLLKIIASDSLLDRIQQGRSATRGRRASIDTPMQSTVSLSGRGPAHGLHGRDSASGGAAMYLSPIRTSIDARA